MRHLHKALAIFPDYGEAHNDLGGLYMRCRGFAHAAAEFQKAATLNPAPAPLQPGVGVYRYRAV
jgi:Flp pilus assembly protein TadD